MKAWLEHLARSHLVDRGYVVLPPLFVGFVVGGNAVIIEHETHFEVAFPVETSRIRPILLTGSQLIKKRG